MLDRKQVTTRILAALLLTLALITCAVELRAADPPTANRYIATASTTALTVQQPATGALQVQFESASVYCASASTVTTSWNGAAATATTLAIKKSPQTQQPPIATAWSGSNVGSGTTGVVYNVPAATERDFDMSLITLGTNGTASNFTFTTNNSCTITVQWVEK